MHIVKANPINQKRFLKTPLIIYISLIYNSYDYIISISKFTTLVKQ